MIPGAIITIRNKETGAQRVIKSADDGFYSAAALPPGEYEIRAEATGFRVTVRPATVLTGNTLTADFEMQVGATSEVISVEAAAAQVSFDSHKIDGVITRQKIQELPLNGRSFLNLAFLEPGVTVGTGSTSQYNSLFTVSVLGGDSNKTSITVDGGNIRNSIEGNSGMNFSQEVVQEFQLSSANFDLSTGITSVGAVNVVTRTGTNDFHGSAYYFFRDHNMSAYPGLVRNALNPDPFFVRRNPGFWVGGPVKKNRLFFFFNYETQNQTQVFTYVPNVASGAALTGNYLSPYKGKTLTARFDYSINQNHRLFARYSHDGNSGFGPNGGARPQSNWLRNKNWSDQSLLGVTSSFTSTVVNDFRFGYQYWQNRNLFPTTNECADCIGLNLPEVSVSGTNIVIGNTSNATQGRDLRRYNITDTVNWQKGTHGIKFGGEIEHAPGTGFWGYCDPACTQVAPPELVRANVPAALVGALFPNLPTSIRTTADFLNLPFLGGVVGIGDPSQPPPYNVDKAKVNNRYRLFAQDSWRVTPKFTLNYGMSWNFESTLVNRDIDKPRYLAPLYGSDLSPTNNNPRNFSPSIGFAWNVDNSNKMVVRGGFGIYYDTELLYRRLQERAFTGPLGNGRVQFPTTGFVNPFPGIVNFSLGGAPIPVGAPLQNGLTNMTLGQFIQILNQQGPAATAALAPKNLNDLSVRTIDINKAAAQLYPKNFPTQRGLHFNIGIQRQMRNDMVLSVDYARRVFLNTLLGELDYNRYNRFINGVRTPVIRPCAAAERSNPAAQCSNGPITFWTPGGRSVYNAMLVKLDKRFARRYMFTASYAMTFQYGYNGINNLDQWNSTWGPNGARHILNVSGVVDIWKGIQLGVISQSSTKGPLTPSIAGVDLTGGGISTAFLQGLPSFNCVNRGCGKEDIEKGVANWNQNFAGKPDGLGKVMPRVVLPANYVLGDNFNSQDIRLTKVFTFRERYKLSIFGEAFNIFNIANLGGHSFSLDQVVPANQTFNFGQPTSRAGQVFGSGGPRAFQLGGRFQF